MITVTSEELTELRKRIRKEATGLTRKQVEEREETAEVIGSLATASDSAFETWQEWYGISYVMQALPPGAGGQEGMERYDPAKDGRPL